MKKQTKTSGLLRGLFLVLSLITVVPAIYLLLHTFYDGTARFTLSGYYEVFLHNPRYLLLFWRSLLLCGVITLGNAAISTLAAYALATLKFKGANLLIFGLAVLMLLPVQTTLAPTYLVLQYFHLLDTQWAIALPALFWPFGTLLEMQVLRALPHELFEAAALDEATTLCIIRRIAVPAAKGGIISVMILTFVEAWNMLEQPVAFLRDAAQYPLAAYLAFSGQKEITVVFICSLLAIIPVLLIFAFFNEELTDGIEFSGIR
ncbi:MAG: carbohydrate ABC transporter permease [Pygmaiobacter sp.]|nr:carbohydrate ABC transporter permease [Pygmaiobacter sp.]